MASDASLDVDDDEGKLLAVEDDVVLCPVARANAFLADFFQYEVSINDMIEPEDELGLDKEVILEVVVAVVESALS